MPSQRYIFWFWLPLALTWLMMAVEGPLLTALVARLDDPVANLAAYGVAFSLALLIEAPVIMLLSATTALVQGQTSLVKMRHFTYLLSAAVTALMLLLSLPPVFWFFAHTLLSLPEKVASLLQLSLIILIPWPAAIGLRRFYQGLLIIGGKPRRVTFGTVVRVLVMGTVGISLFNHSELAGAHIGALALSAGVIAECIACRLMVQRELKDIAARPNDPQSDVTLKQIAYFYYPLALTSFLGLGIQPLTTFFVARSAMAVESLAVIPVVTGVVFIFRALGLAYQEVTIALMGKNWEHFQSLKRFALRLAAVNTTVLVLWTLSPFATFWFENVAGLSKELSAFAKPPLMIMMVMPAFAVLLSWQRTVLILARATKAISVATAIEVAAVVAFLSYVIYSQQIVGAIGAAYALVLARTIACLYLLPIVKKKRHQAIKLAREDLSPSLRSQ